MLRILTCLTNEHDWRLVIVAGVVCLLTSLAATSLFQRSRESQGRERSGWILTASVAGGSGIWATHFIAMMAYDSGVVTGYDIALTVGSLVVAIVMTAFGLAIASSGSIQRGAAGGAIVGIGIAVMHYLGMWGIEIPGTFVWSLDLVVTSIVLGVVLATTAFAIAVRRRRPFETIMGGLFLTLAIVSLHFTAMSAITVLPDPALTIGNPSLSPHVLTTAVAGLALAVLGMSMVAVLADRRLRRLYREQNRRLDAALNNMSQGLAMFDSAGRLVICNQHYLRMYNLPPQIVKPGYALRELLELRIEQGTFSGNPAEYINDLLSVIAEGKASATTVETGDGRVISVVNSPMAGGGWVATHEDITDRRRAEQQRDQTKHFLDMVIEHVPATIVVKDAHDFRYVLVNRAGEEFYGLPSEQIIGKTAHEIFTKDAADSIMARDRKLIETNQDEFFNDYQIDTPNNGLRLAMMRRGVVRGADGNVQYILSVIEDVTERRRMEARVAHMARHDVLTDLPNRTAFNETLTRTLDEAARAKSSFAILCVDIDGFSEVNDVFGNSVGDMLLCAMAQRLKTAADGIFLARLGGDEFALLAVNGEQPAASAQLADRLLAAMAEDFEVDGHKPKVGISIGIAVYPNDGADVASLMAEAAAALYRAKAEGRGSYRFFEADMDQRLRERRALVHDLRNALERGEIIVHYQPQARIDGEIVGFEALARWLHPSRGMVPPGEFIPLAEESGLILPIGEWILREACREAASWPRQLNIAINLSPVQFRHGDLPGLVHAVLLETGLAPDRLEFEITESMLIDDLSRALSILRRLKLLGVRIAMDDFGTGYSSLSNLQAFPFDKIKIDRSFITNLLTNPQSATIVRVVIALGRGLNLPVMAEGVETREQLAFLAAEACNEVQGFLIGKPMPIDAYGEMTGHGPAKRKAVGV